MEFNLKPFFNEEDPPRLQKDFKTSVYLFTTRLVERIADHLCGFRITRVLPRHVPIVMFTLCQDPLTKLGRSGEVVVYRSRIKDLSKIFASVLSRLEQKLSNAEKPTADRPLSKCIRAILDKRGIYIGPKSIVMLTACVSEIIGIIVNSAYRASHTKLLTVEKLWEHAATHTLSSSGERCTNRSLLRFLKVLEIADDPTEAAERPPTVHCKFEAPEQKMVSFVP
jgi:hypothetical protein